MNALVFAVGVALLATVEGGDSGYGAPAAPAAYGAPAYEQGGQTFKHVYVHSAPDEAPDVQSRVIRVPGGDKHVNIIFVKAPSSSSQSNTEVILPEQDEQKTLVYVLLKKGENTADVRIRKPAPAQQQKPDVYFIRYKDQPASSGYGAPAAPAPAPVRTPSTEYGAF